MESEISNARAPSHLFNSRERDNQYLEVQVLAIWL